MLLVFFMKPNPDTEAYQACSSISEYRSYMQVFGSNGIHYNEAKAIVDKYVADSTAKAKQAEAKERAEAAAKAKAEAEAKEDASYKNCTTIAACDSYLNTYPQGRYVSEVKSKKAELEKKEAEAAAKKASAKKQIEKQQGGNKNSAKPSKEQKKSGNKKFKAKH